MFKYNLNLKIVINSKKNILHHLNFMDVKIALTDFTQYFRIQINLV